MPCSALLERLGRRPRRRPRRRAGRARRRRRPRRRRRRPPSRAAPGARWRRRRCSTALAISLAGALGVGGGVRRPRARSGRSRPRSTGSSRPAWRRGRCRCAGSRPAPSPSPSATLRSRRSSASASSAELGALGGVARRAASAIASVSASIERARITSTLVSKTTKTACRRTMPRLRWAVRHHPDGRAAVLEHHEREVVRRRSRPAAIDDHAPVAVDEQERQRAEEVEVHLDHARAPGAMNSASTPSGRRR